MSGRVAVTESHQEKSRALLSLTKGRQISTTGALCGMAYQKIKVRTFKTTTFTKNERKNNFEVENFGTKLL